MKTEVNNPTHQKLTSLEPSVSVQKLKSIEETHLEFIAFEFSEFKSDFAHFQYENRKTAPTVETNIKLLLAKLDDMGNTEMYSANYDDYYKAVLESELYQN